MTITRVHGRQILDSRGKPTVEVEIELDDGTIGRASVPSGESAGRHEAWELRDQDPDHFGGQSVEQAISHVNHDLGPAILNNDPVDQITLDQELVTRDATLNLSRYGANAILGISLATSRAVANSQDIPYYRYLHQLYLKLGGSHLQLKFPIPTFNIINGGAHTDWQTTDFQEFMIVPHAAGSFAQQLEQGVEVYQALQSLLKKQGLSTMVGDEGGFAPALKSNAQAVELILQAISQAGFQTGQQISLALDPAASQLYQAHHHQYRLPIEGQTLSTGQLIEWWEKWTNQYPILSLEDGLAEDDWSGWPQLQQRVGQRVVIIGDDLLATNPSRIEKAISLKACSGLLAKINQIGTLSEAMTAIITAQQAGWQISISHRSGETEDTAIADLAVAVGADYAKMGAPARSERVAKYNQLLRIEEELTHLHDY